MEIAAVAAEVLPDYQGRVAFVDAVTADPGAREVLVRYPVQYIPTSFFVDGDGEIVETCIGPLTEEQLRDRLNGLAASAE